MPASRYTGVDNLLAPDNCTLLLIDHQPSQLASVQNIDRPEQRTINRTTLNAWEDPRVVAAIAGVADIMYTHGGTVGANIAWETQLLK